MTKEETVDESAAVYDAHNMAYYCYNIYFAVTYK